MASESDMRRRTNSQEVPLPDAFPNAGKHLQPLQENLAAVQASANPTELSDHIPSDPAAAAASPSGPEPSDVSSADRPSADEPEPRVSSMQLPTRAQSPPLPDETKYRRFSMLRFRNASDSQLSIRAKQQAETPPPLPPLPDSRRPSFPANVVAWRRLQIRSSRPSPLIRFGPFLTCRSTCHRHDRPDL